jgi:hypothetical protein
MYRAMVKEGFIKCETNTISFRKKDVIISYECRRLLYFIDSLPRMREMTTRALLVASYLVHELL